MKARPVLFSISVSIFFGGAYSSDRLSSFGSNPLLSQELFPQDISAWNSNSFLIFPSYEKSPSWGDIDEPLNKPDGNYTSTGIDIATQNAKFSHTSKVHTFDTRIGYLHNFLSGPVPAACLIADWNFDGRYTHAEGNLTNTDGGKIPFDYSMLHGVNSLHLRGDMCYSLFGIPSGVRVEGGFQNTLLVNQHFDFTKNGVDYHSKRAVWGWSTSGCNHIFGSRKAEGDAWLQDGYARGPIYDIALRNGVTLPRGKFGAEIGYRGGHQDYYRWTPEPSTIKDTVIKANFEGSYQKGNWSTTTSDFFSGLYGNIVIKSSQRYSFNTFVALGYQGEAKGEALSGNLDIANNSKEKCKSFSVMAAPNISIPFIPFFSYIDFAIRTSYAYSRFGNTDMRYIGGGQLETWQDSHTDAADENYRQPYSYANRNVMNAGIDLSAMYPLLTNDVHRVGFGLQLLINTRFMYMTKYYGQNVVNGTDVDFSVSRLRKDFEKEIQFATGVKLQYQRSPYFAWIELTEPLLRSLLPRTRVYDAGKKLLYEHEKSPLWMSQEGLRVGVYVAYEWTLPWLMGK